jgi:hypothetical protein
VFTDRPGVALQPVLAGDAGDGAGYRVDEGADDLIWGGERVDLAADGGDGVLLPLGERDQSCSAKVVLAQIS